MLQKSAIRVRSVWRSQSRDHLRKSILHRVQLKESTLRAELPEDAVVVADGGDFWSFARVGLPASTYLNLGSLGCIGVGTPFGIAARLALPKRTVVVATGDGAFGFNAMEIDTADRHKAPVLDVLVTPEAASSDAKSGLAWVPDLQALGAWDSAEKNWRA